jgi:hypothetical protein
MSIAPGRIVIGRGGRPTDRSPGRLVMACYQPWLGSKGVLD